MEQRQQAVERSEAAAIATARAELVAVNAELDALAYGVSHDLRAPLRAISGYAQILQEGFADQLPVAGADYLRKLQASAVDMGERLDGLLALSRVGRAELSRDQLDMTALARECWHALAGERDGRGVRLELHELPEATGDRRLVRQVWAHLLRNAVTYTGSREDARVRVSAESGEYQVQDNGVGFDMAHADRIGVPFQRLHTDADFPGTGIGLALVRRIVHRHGGTLSVHGEPGAGARIGFTLGGTR